MRSFQTPLLSVVGVLAFTVLLIAALLTVAMLATVQEIPAVSRLICEVTGGEWKVGRILTGCFDLRNG